MPFELLIPEETLTKPQKKSQSKPRVKKAKLEDNRGCEHCPQNKTEGIRKIFGKIEGKEWAIFAQSPGSDENDKGIELVGKAGKWWWKELKPFGMTRDMFDVQNVMRCYPADWEENSHRSYPELKMRDPTKEELRCCSLYTDRALEKIRAKQILVLGKVAARQLLQTRSIPDQKIFWSDKLNARIYLVDHPSYFVRGTATKEKLETFRKTLEVFVKDSGKEETKDQFGYIKSQDYRLVLDEKQAEEATRIIRKYAGKGRRISVDIEDSPVNTQREGEKPATEPPVTGNVLLNGDLGRVVTTCGFCPKPGLVFVFIFDHKDQDKYQGNRVWYAAKLLLEDETIKKAMHYGCTDVTKLKEWAGITVRGFDHDTNKSEYLRFPDAKAYGLDAIVERRFPQFSGYSLIVVKELMQEQPDVPENIKNASLSVQQKYLYKHGLVDFTNLSLETLRLYNGADCDITKRLEIQNKKYVPQALLTLYIDLSFILQKMEVNGPWFDYEQHAKLDIVYPYREKKLKRELRRMAGNKEFNPGSPDQVKKVLYKTLKLEYPFDGKPNTGKQTLLMLQREHPFPGKQLEWRVASKAHGTYVTSYKASADFYGGRVRTTWWDTGTRTGRLSSGGGKEKFKINLQNIHGDPQIQNLCVADPRWKRAYHAIKKILRACKSDELAAVRVEEWLREEMPDLKTFLILDYGQIEVRVYAQLSGDKNLKKDCETSDIHTAVGASMGWDAKKVANDKKTRTFTKNIHFGILFGNSEEGTWRFVLTRTPPEEQDSISRGAVGKAYKRYFKKYSGVQVYIDNQREFGEEHEYVQTAFGMKQPLNIHAGKHAEDGDSGDDSGRGSWWGNQAINGPVQGTAHQLLVCGLVNIRRQQEKYKLLDPPSMDVHDALDFIVNVVDLPEAYKKARELMETESLETVKKDFPDIDWKVPIVTEAEAGLSLGCKIKLNEGFTVGKYMLDWYRKRQKQIISLNKELSQISSIQ